MVNHQRGPPPRLWWEPPPTTQRGHPLYRGGGLCARCAETNFPAGINQGQQATPLSHQCTAELSSFLFLIPVVAAMGRVAVRRAFVGINWRKLTFISRDTVAMFCQLQAKVFFAKSSTSSHPSTPPPPLNCAEC